MSARRFFWMSYHFPKEEGKKLPPHLVRDGAAFAELSAAFYTLDYEYGGLLFNLPAAGVQAMRYQPPRCGVAADWADLTENDVLVLPTRPPLDDVVQQDRKRVRRSLTWLECQAFYALGPFFQICARSHMELAAVFADQFRPGFKNRIDAKFHQYPWAWYKELKIYGQLRYEIQPADQRLTAGYLLCCRMLTADGKMGPRILAAFGMGGTETLVWSHYLRSEESGKSAFRRMLDSKTPRLIIGEMVGPNPQDEQILSMSFAKRWRVTIILDADGPGASFP